MASGRKLAGRPGRGARFEKGNFRLHRPAGDKSDNIGRGRAITDGGVGGRVELKRYPVSREPATSVSRRADGSRRDAARHGGARRSNETSLRVKTVPGFLPACRRGSRKQRETSDETREIFRIQAARRAEEPRAEPPRREYDYTVASEAKIQLGVPESGNDFE